MFSCIPIDKANDVFNMGAQQSPPVRGRGMSHLHTVGHKNGCATPVSVQTYHPTDAQRRNGRPETAPSIQA